MKNWSYKNYYLFFFGIIISGIFFWGVPIYAQSNVSQDNPVLTASLDRGSATIGSIVTLTLNFQLPAEASLPDKPQIGGLEDLTIITQKIEKNRITIRLMVDSLGSWKTGPLTLSYRDENNSPRTLTADPVTLNVASNLGEKPEEAQLKPIQDIIPIRPLWLKYLPWAIGALSFLIFLYVLFRLLRNRRQKSTVITLDPPHIQARKELEKLQAEGLFEKGEIKAFYFRFSEILRHYLEAIRGFPAAEYTTEEISIYVKEEVDRKLIHLLKNADLVKFADHAPTTARKEQEFGEALTYIEETSPPLDSENQGAQGAKP